MPDIFINPTITNQKIRSRRVEIITKYQTDPKITFETEIISLDSNANQVGNGYDILPVVRMASSVYGENITLLNGKEISIAELHEAIETFFVKWYQEDTIVVEEPIP